MRGSARAVIAVDGTLLARRRRGKRLGDGLWEVVGRRDKPGSRRHGGTLTSGNGARQ